MKMNLLRNELNLGKGRRSLRKLKKRAERKKKEEKHEQQRSEKEKRKRNKEKQKRKQEHTRVIDTEGARGTNGESANNSKIVARSGWRDVRGRAGKAK